MDLNKILIEHLLYPAMELKNGNRTRQYTKELLASEKLSLEELKALQRQRLKELLLHCKRTVPAYAALDEALIEEDPYKALRSIPPLGKDQFNRNPDLYLSSAVPAADRIPNNTGGSTGVPTRFFMTRPQVEQYEAARWRGLGRFGVTFGSRSVMLWGNPIELSQAEQKSYAQKEKLLKNRLIVSAYNLSQDSAEEFIELLNSYKPEYLYGYANALKVFAQMIDPSKLKIRLKAVVSTSETLVDEDRDLIASAFGCPVANEYGARDAGILAYSCPKGHMHLNIENAFFEVLDPRTLEPIEKAGESGVLAVTDLLTRAQPRLRWLLGDSITLSDDTPDCGITLPLVKSIDGRNDAILVGSGGKLIHGHSLYHILRNYPSVRQFQFIQHSPEKCTLILAADRQDEISEETAKEITSRINEIEASWQIETRFVDSIEVPASGKVRYAIREFPL